MYFVFTSVLLFIILIILLKLNSDEIEKIGKKTHKYSVVFMVCFCFIHTCCSISLEMLYLSPHEQWGNTRESILTKQIMNCARHRLHSLSTQWDKIENCLIHVEQYHISKGRMPYLRPVPIAFVFRMDDDAIFTMPAFDKMSDVDKVLIMIHECAHNSLRAVDHAYIWESKFNTLSRKQHLHNADSYASAVAHECTNSSYIY